MYKDHSKILEGRLAQVVTIDSLSKDPAIYQGDAGKTLRSADRISHKQFIRLPWNIAQHIQDP